MSLNTRLSDLVTAIATRAKADRTLINGNVSNLAALNTTNKSNLVVAINEVITMIAGAGGASIDDAVISLTKVWSSTKTDSEITSRVNALVAAAPGLLDTLDEIAAALGDDPNFATTVTGLIAGKVSLTGDETIAGIKTFSSAPVVPANAFAIDRINGLQTALNAKITGFADPNADRIVFWDDSAGVYAALTLSAPLSISGTTMSVATASETAVGVIELATLAEVTTGTDTARAVTPAGVRQEINTRAAASHTHTAANITDFSTAVPAAVPSASDTVQGKVELATTTEAAAGTDTARAITPAGLRAVTGDVETDLAAAFAAALV